jgi:hypothetical protein
MGGKWHPGNYAGRGRVWDDRTADLKVTQPAAGGGHYKNTRN